MTDAILGTGGRRPCRDRDGGGGAGGVTYKGKVCSALIGNLVVNPGNLRRECRAKVGLIQRVGTVGGDVRRCGGGELFRVSVAVCGVVVGVSL